MLIGSLTQAQRTTKSRSLPKAQPAEEANPQPQESFLRSAGSKALDVIKKVGKSSLKYIKPAMIAAAPAVATAVALSMGGVPAAAMAILGSGAVGAVAGVAAWGKDIGVIRGAAGGALTGMFSGSLGALGGSIGVVNMAAIGATREAILRHVADVPKS